MSLFEFYEPFSPHTQSVIFILCDIIYIFIILLLLFYYSNYSTLILYLTIHLKFIPLQLQNQKRYLLYYCRYKKIYFT